VETVVLLSLQICFAQIRAIPNGSTSTIYSGDKSVSGYLVVYPPDNGPGLSDTVTVNVDTNKLVMTLFRGEVLGIADSTSIVVKANGTTGAGTVPIAIVLFYAGTNTIS
jgi:hypothetical protein